jgi:phosphotransferase system HPr (HPr) family protein
MGSRTAPIVKETVIRNRLGLHARAAGQIALLAQKAAHPVWLQCGDVRADASSIIDILTLACGKGSPIRVMVESPEDRAVLEAIIELVEQGFGEEDA